MNNDEEISLIFEFIRREETPAVVEYFLSKGDVVKKGYIYSPEMVNLN